MSYLDKKIEDYAHGESDENLVFECEELDYYDAPQESSIPEGVYAAMLMGFQFHSDKFKTRYVDVCYKIFSSATYTQWNEKIIDKITYFYIRIRYIRGSDEERRFRVAMSGLCKKKKFTANELIGIVELIDLSYQRNGEATIEQHISTELNSYWFEDDITDDFYWSSGYEL